MITIKSSPNNNKSMAGMSTDPGGSGLLIDITGGTPINQLSQHQRKLITQLS